MKIALTGSLGNISKPLAQQLLAAGHMVNVISSTAGRQQEIESLGAKPVIGDINDSRFLTAAFKGSDAVYCMIPPNFTHPDQLKYYETLGKNYATAIEQSGIKRVLNLSSYGAHLASGAGFITGAYRAEQILNSVDGIQLTHLRPTYFY